MINLMIQWLKRHFIPHHGNDHRPHFLRTENARAILAIVLVFELVAFILPSLNFVGLVNNSNLGAVLPAVLGTLTNKERAHYNLSELQSNPILDEAARLKAEDMATKGYFAHTSPEGKTAWYWLNKVNYEYEYAGENLAINFSDSEDVTQAWMNSPTHRANVVKSSYTEIGTGIATGMFEGRETIFVAQIYANPRVTKAPVILPPIQSSTSIKEESPVVTVSEPEDVPEQPEQILGVSAEQEPTLLAKVAASPRHSTNAVFMVILGIVLTALLLGIVIRMNLRHLDLITNGLLVVTIVGGILVINGYLGTRNITIGQSIDYSADQVNVVI